MAITSGTKAAFTAQNAPNIAVNYSTSDTVMVIYNGDGLWQNLGGRTIHYTSGPGTEYTIATAIGYLDMDIVQDSKHVVVYADASDGYKLKATILTPSGFSSPTTIDSNSCSDCRVAAAGLLGEALVVYRAGSNFYAAELNVSGLTVSLVGSPVASGINQSPHSLEALESGRYLLAYSNNFSSVSFVVIDLSGGISYGTPATKTFSFNFDPNTIMPPHGLALFASDKVFAAYNKLDCVVVRTSTDPPTFGAVYAAANIMISVYEIDTTSVIISRTDGSDLYVETFDIDVSDNITARGDGGVVLTESPYFGTGGLALTDTVNGYGIVVNRSSSDSTRRGFYNTLQNLPIPPAPPTPSLTHSAAGLPGAILI